MSAKKVEEEEDDCATPTVRDWVFAFYSEHNPEKLSSVDTILGKFAGKEEELVRQLLRKYGPQHSKARFAEGAARCDEEGGVGEGEGEVPRETKTALRGSRGGEGGGDADGATTVAACALACARVRVATCACAAKNCAANACACAANASRREGDVLEEARDSDALRRRLAAADEQLTALAEENGRLQRAVADSCTLAETARNERAHALETARKNCERDRGLRESAQRQLKERFASESRSRETCAHATSHARVADARVAALAAESASSALATRAKHRALCAALDTQMQLKSQLDATLSALAQHAVGNNKKHAHPRLAGDRL